MFSEIRGHTIFASVINDSSVILDLGANHGAFAREMTKRYGGTYHLVEANPLLGRQLVAEGWRFVLPFAVAAEEGPIRFNLAMNDECSSLLPFPSASAYQYVLCDTVEVRARKLESIIAEIAAPTIDLIKMDIEGAEMSVLESLPKSILDRIGQITVEFHSDPVFGFGTHDNVAKIVRQLRRAGFWCMDFSYRAGETRRDVLFINRAMHRISWVRSLWWKLRLTLVRVARHGCDVCGNWFRSIRSLLPPPWQDYLRRR